MIVKLLTERHLGFLSLKGGCTGSSESIHVKMARCFVLFDLILYVHSTIFQLCGTGLPGLNQY